MNQDLAKMKPTLFPENKVFCLTPESKIDKWINIIKKKAQEGNQVKLYSDIESTRFAYWNRGRAKYDEVIDRKEIEKDAAKFGIEIEAMSNPDFLLDLKHPLCSSLHFEERAPSPFAMLFFGKSVFESKGRDFYAIENAIKNHQGLDFFSSIYEDLDSYTKKDLFFNAKKEIGTIKRKTFAKLKKEAESMDGKVDRMIEYAFVACYENQDGEVFLLKDDDDDLIYFHEFVYPMDGKIKKEEQVVQSMPIIPYLIHKTTFDFLKGEEEHPFLGIKLDKEAPNAGEIFKVLIRLFDSENEEDKETLGDNIKLFFHNGDGFDTPFLDEEMNRYFEDLKMRDLTQVYDTLKIAKAMIPSDAQKFIAACQHNKNFGGNEDLKNDPDFGIKPTSKSLDNLKCLATYLIDFDPNKPKRIYEKSQAKFFEMFKNHFESENIDWKKFENMLEYSNTKNGDLNLTKGFKKPKKTEKEYSSLMDRYSKYQEGRKDYIKLLNNLKKHELIYENINNIKTNIENNVFLQEALYRLNNVDRSAHGARVDSQLFMDAFIVLENAFYIKPKMSKEKRSIALDSLEIPQDIKTLLENKIKGE